MRTDPALATTFVIQHKLPLDLGYRRAQFAKRSSLLRKLASRWASHTVAIPKGVLMNHVNIATMMHQLALLISGTSCQNLLLKEHNNLLQQLTSAVRDNIQHFDLRNVTTIIWAYGKIGRGALTIVTPKTSVPEVFSLLIEKAEKNIHRLSCKETLSIVVGLANMEFQARTFDDLMKKVIKSVIKNLDEFTSREQVNLVWALGRLRASRSCFPLLNLIVKNCEQSVYELTPQQMSNLLWGLARLRYSRQASLFHLVVDACSERITEFTPQGISNLLWSFSSIMYYPGQQFLHLVASHSSDRIDEFEPQHVSMLLYAFGIFGTANAAERLAASAKTYFRKNARDFTLNGRCNLMWGLTMLGYLDMDIFKVGMTHAYKPLKFFKMRDINKRKIYQCIIDLKIFSSQQIPSDVVRPELEDELCEAWSRGQNSKPIYAAGLAILITLEKMGYVPSSRFMPEVVPVVVDSATRADGKRIAIEISINNHYFINWRDRVEGPRLWAMRVLEAQGFVVLRIDAKEWEELEIESRKPFLISRINAVYKS